MSNDPTVSQFDQIEEQDRQKRLAISLVVNLGFEGATQALNNFAHSDEITTETEHGLKWLALQIDSIMVELRDRWDELHPSRPREVS